MIKALIKKSNLEEILVGNKVIVKEQWKIYETGLIVLIQKILHILTSIIIAISGNKGIEGIFFYLLTVI